MEESSSRCMLMSLDAELKEARLEFNKRRVEIISFQGGYQVKVFSLLIPAKSAKKKFKVRCFVIFTLFVCESCKASVAWTRCLRPG